MKYKEWLKWRESYFKKERDMSSKNWKDLFTGLSIIMMSLSFLK
jgi:hypothetical protein